jgi:hypothetical protein
MRLFSRSRRKAPNNPDGSSPRHGLIASITTPPKKAFGQLWTYTRPAALFAWLDRMQQLNGTYDPPRDPYAKFKQPAIDPGDGIPNELINRAVPLALVTDDHVDPLADRTDRPITIGHHGQLTALAA